MPLSRRPLESLDWNLVRSFIAVVDTGSLAAAARDLGLAHPTVARHIQQLESALGIGLFERRPTGLVLNRAGARLAASARGMRESARIFEQVTTSVRTSGSGLARITAPETVAGILPDLLAPLQMRDPDDFIQIDLLIASEEFNLLQQAADMGVRHAQPQQQELICRRLAPLPHATYASPEYLRRYGDPVVDQLGSHRFIDAVTAPRLARHAERIGRPLAREQFVFRSDSLTARVQAALAGWGIVAVPVHVGEATPGLQRIFPDEPEHRLEMWLVGRPEVRTVAYLYETFMMLADVLNNFVSEVRPGQSAELRPKRAVSR